MSAMKSRKLMKYFIGLVVLGLVILLLPLSALFGSGSGNDVNLNDYTPSLGGEQCCSSSGILLKWDAGSLFDDEKSWEVNVANPMGDYENECDEGYEPEVVGVCVKTGGGENVLFTSSDDDDYVEVVISGSYASVTEKVTEGEGGDVSHICIYYSCEEEPDEGKFRITKNILDGPLSEDITFYFNVNPELSGNPNPIGVTITAGSTSNSSSWFTVPADGTNYTINEVNIPAGWQFESSNNTSFTINTDDQEETAVFTDEKQTGCLEISKEMVGDLPETGSFTFVFSIYDASSGGNEVLSDIEITIDRPAETGSTV